MWIERRGLMIVGGVSLLLNVFLIGIVLGHILAVDRRLPSPSPGPQGGPGGIGMIQGAQVKGLPPDQKRRFMDAMASHRPAIRTAREGHRAARQTIEADIAAPTFDRDKVATDFAALRRANDAIGEAVNGALLDALEQLSPESRVSIVAHQPPGKPAPPHP